MVPHIADQFFWADVLRRLGVAAAPLRATALDARGLQSRMREVLSMPDKAARAEALAAKLREERGAQRACEYIEQLASHGEDRTAQL